MPAFAPILTRAWRTQWRDARGFVLLLLLVGALSALLVWRYGVEALAPNGADFPGRIRVVGATLWRQSAWLQTLVALVVAPALTAGAIARERERGLLEALQMTPLAPLQIAVEKWGSALAPMLLTLGALLPLNLMLVLSGGAAPGELVVLTAFQLACAAGGAALGLACSAWARRAHLALRSAYGFLMLWLIGSGAAAIAVGETPLPLRWLVAPPFYVAWWGRTNPLLAVSDLFAGATLMPTKWPYVLTLLALICALSLWTTTRALRRPLVEAPFIGANFKRPNHKPAALLGYFELPFIGALRFANPVMGREVRSKFRLRQPPVSVIIVEMVLALLVLFFYARTIGVAWVDPKSRKIIFFGVAFTGLIVTAISCAIMGANSFGREVEGNAWDNLRLSLLRPREILAGKVGGIFFTCALFSLPVWPLLLPCISWRGPFAPLPYSSSVAPSQLVAVVAVWLGLMVAATQWGLWVGRRLRAGSAAGVTLGVGAVWLVGGPLLEAGGGARLSQWLSALNPFGALVAASDITPQTGWWLLLGAPFLGAMLLFGALVWALLEWGMKREFG